MKVTFEVDDQINIAGTSRSGKIKTTFKKIVSVFGPPSSRMGDKTFNEWAIQFRVPDDSDAGDFDYVVATIYDWYEETDPARNPTDLYTFNIGGHDMESAYFVHQFLGESPS